MTSEEIEVVEAMERWGGGFVKALAECFRRADVHNFRILRASFSEYWNDYSEMGRKARHRGGSDETT